MKKVSMFDEFGEEHLVDESELIDRSSAYGIVFVDEQSSFGRNKKLLMIQDKNSKTWEFPGGGLEVGESKEEGLVREFLEETGLRIDPQNIKFFKHISDYFYSNLYSQAWNSLRYFYFAEIVGGEILNYGNGDDTVAARFLSREEVEKLEIKPKIRELVNEVFHLVVI